MPSVQGSIPARVGQRLAVEWPVGAPVQHGCRILSPYRQTKRCHCPTASRSKAAPADYFPRFGFAETTRAVVPEDVARTEEFRGACPASAIVMVQSTSSWAESA
jgi:hypothetical protein